MPTSPERFSQLRWLQNLTCILAILGALIVIACGMLGFTSSAGWLVVAGGFILFIAIMIMTLTPLLLQIEASSVRNFHEIRELHREIGRQVELLTAIAENTEISDSAKSLAHRDQELNALRKVIKDEIEGERWESALNFVDEIERRFGFKQEADAIRGELDQARSSAIQSKLSAAISLIESHFAAYEWDRAQSEIDRLMAALPGDAKVQSLRDRMMELKDLHKGQLKKEWDEAVRRSDTDRAIDLLRELDQYLSPAEVQALQASARDVFKEKLLQLGVQFRFAVNEKRWDDALAIGLELVRDFPNARMAAEVRGALDTLRERARHADTGTASAAPSS